MSSAPPFHTSTRWRTCLVQPGESVGNVGQLAVDLLIATCGGMRLVGYLESPFVQPVAGLDAFRSDGTLHLALELYEDAERGLFVLQQRAPTLRGCAAQFAAQLADWLHSSGFSEVISSATPFSMLLCELGAGRRWRMDGQNKHHVQPLA